MDELARLGKLLQHWMEHNDEHAETYRDWAEKASSLGNEDLSKVLNSLHDQTKRLKDLFDEALGTLQQVK
jgi:rubrerythrin